MTERELIRKLKPCCDAPAIEIVHSFICIEFRLFCRNCNKIVIVDEIHEPLDLIQRWNSEEEVEDTGLELLCMELTGGLKDA